MFTKQNAPSTRAASQSLVMDRANHGRVAAEKLVSSSWQSWRQRRGVKNERDFDSCWFRNINMLTIRTVAIATDPTVVLARQPPDVAS